MHFYTFLQKHSELCEKSRVGVNSRDERKEDTEVQRYNNNNPHYTHTHTHTRAPPSHTHTHATHTTHTHTHTHAHPHHTHTHTHGAGNSGFLKKIAIYLQPGNSKPQN